MNESVVGGLIIGAVFMAVAVVAQLCWRLARSPSERARRTKWVLGLALGLPVLALLAQDLGLMGSGVVLALALGAVWIFKASKAP